jgi:hypothetical protein
MTEEEAKRARFMIERQHAAYAYPSGSWFQRWIPRVCKHEKIRCVHGDEIIARRYRRIACMVCGRSLKGPLPDMCFFTGYTHG